MSGKFVFDAQGRLTGAPGNVTVGYDQAGFAPATLTAPGGKITYAHDALGRRTSSVVTGEPTSVGATSDRVSGAAGKSWSYGWGVDSTLTSITQTDADGKPTASGVKVDYGYAPDGLLLSRTPTGGQVEHVTWNRLAGIARMLALADTEFVYGLGQAPVAQTTAGKADVDGLVWLHTDRLGSVVATTDVAGAGGAGMVGKASGDAARDKAARLYPGARKEQSYDNDIGPGPRRVGFDAPFGSHVQIVEVKSGKVPMSPRGTRQIDKDVNIVQRADNDVRRSVSHFEPNAKGELGPVESVAKYLESKGYKKYGQRWILDP